MLGSAARITTPNALLCSNGHWVSNQFKARPELLMAPSIFEALAVVLVSIFMIQLISKPGKVNTKPYLSLTICLATAIQLVTELFLFFSQTTVQQSRAIYS